mmetsp:Transcript_3901/g.8250  ORF Transcript_3901/g.8250 Transcript_3901/m.8250 type:complete len:205 (-) Transcript_3901:1008-1622(-)
MFRVSSSTSFVFSRSRCSAVCICWYRCSTCFICDVSTAFSRSFASIACSCLCDSLRSSSLWACSMDPLSRARLSFVCVSSLCALLRADACCRLSSSSARMAAASCLRAAASSDSRLASDALSSLLAEASLAPRSSRSRVSSLRTAATSSSLALSCFWWTELSLAISLSFSRISCERSCVKSSSRASIRLLCAALSLASFSSFSF